MVGLGVVGDFREEVTDIEAIDKLKVNSNRTSWNVT